MEIIKKSKQKTKKIFNSKKKLRILNIGRLTDQKELNDFSKIIKNYQKMILILRRQLLEEEI